MLIFKHFLSFRIPRKLKNQVKQIKSLMRRKTLIEKRQYRKQVKQRIPSKA